eukprot:TRINITY_DN2000_c0_g1_i1.p1 TRINITY_DN2000_c0_g1~~TRINITY_DN2000_c0_g1_i1.p1  ORF type:complete len:535 (-),score=145.97 TRINITY_DN2000_c0_g1_i1:198-1802(-)
MAYDAYGREGYAGSYEDYGDQGYNARELEGYDEQQVSQPGVVPEVVKTFVVYLYRHIREKNVNEIHHMYSASFAKLSDRLFQQQPWPPVEAIAPLVDNDHVFCLLYSEMCFRHLYAKLSPTLAQRCESWDTYCNLFQVIVHGNVNMLLPNQWLWDMVDEFCYQFQSFCQFRAKLKSRTEEELSLLRQCDQVWNVYGVLNYLQALIDKSAIIPILDQEAEGQGGSTFTSLDGMDPNGGSNVLRVLGYFSIIGLLRVHCLLGDYHTAVARLAPIELGRSGVFQRIIGCQITTLYYYGFASMMQRKYVDAIRAFNVILLSISKTKQFHEGTPQYEQILKKNEQMYALLAICLSLCPHTKLVEESVNVQLREKNGEKMQRMQRGDETAYDELFSYACPKFITPAPPDYDAPPANYNQDAYRLQLKMFLQDVRQQQVMAGVRSYLRLYSSISLPKLATFLDIDEAALRTTLLTFKHKTHVVDADGSSDSSNTADVDFYINNDMVHTVDAKVTRRFGDLFIRHIIKFEEVTLELESLPVL